jgi:polysaccharide export outer membrane protein
MLSTATPLASAQQPQQQPADSSQKKGALGKIFGGSPREKQQKQQQPAAPEQTKAAPQQQPAQTKPATRQQQPTGAQAPGAATERLEPDDVNGAQSDLPGEVQANRRGQRSEEEAAVLPYYNNFLATYRLGPEDVISINVFNQERYSKAGIVIPPDGVISYYLVPEGVFVAGKTTRQVQDELTKRLDEYIIDPKVTVTLEKAMSARYSVLGDVVQPGVKLMTRRLSVYEALSEAGGVLATGDKSKVFILRRQSDGTMQPIAVNVKEIERGRAKEMAYLVPGDQVVVPGNRFKTVQQILNLLPILSFARIFTGGW